MGKCDWCGRPTENNGRFCSNKCKKEYYESNPNEARTNGCLKNLFYLFILACMALYFLIEWGVI